MSAIHRAREWFDQRFGASAPSSTPRYVLTGVLVVVILGCGILITRFILPGSGRPKERHFWCLETKTELTFGPDDILGMPDMANSLSLPLYKNPDTGRRTLISMYHCPSCKQYFVAEAEKNVDLKRSQPKDPNYEIICPCGTDLREWVRAEHKKKKR